MKKLLAIVLTLALSLGLSVTAFATDTENSTITPGQDGNPSPSGASTAVEFSVAPTYTITIPKTVELSKQTDANGAVTYKHDASITASAVRLLSGQEIQVTLSAGEDGFVLKTEQNASLPYTVTVDGNTETIGSGDTVATFGTSATEKTSTLHFAAADPTYAGSYSDTVTFGISILEP